MAEIRLVAIDLDGTLVQQAHHISARNQEAVRRAVARGVIVVLATGRMHQSAVPFVERLGLPPTTPIISYNGAMIREAEGAAPLWHLGVPPELAAEVVQHSVEERLFLHYFLRDTLYVTHMHHWARLYQSRANVTPVPVGDLRRFAGESPTKLLLATYPEQALARLERERALFGERLYVTRSMPEYIELLHPQVSKGAALAWLAEYLGVAREYVLAIGDMLNDLPMIEWAGVGVAMPQGEEAVRAVADFVPQSAEAGVAEALERFVLQ